MKKREKVENITMCAALNFIEFLSRNVVCM